MSWLGFQITRYRRCCEHIQNISPHVYETPPHINAKLKINFETFDYFNLISNLELSEDRTTHETLRAAEADDEKVLV